MTKDLYKQRDWLKDQYLFRKKSTYEIGREFGHIPGKILYWLKKLDIPIRNRSEAQQIAQGNHVLLSKLALEFLTGELLGDGHLDCYNEWSSAYFYSSKHKSYLIWISKSFQKFGIGGKLGELKSTKFTLKGMLRNILLSFIIVDTILSLKIFGGDGTDQLRKKKEKQVGNSSK